MQSGLTQIKTNKQTQTCCFALTALMTPVNVEFFKTKQTVSEHHVVHRTMTWGEQIVNVTFHREPRRAEGGHFLKKTKKSPGPDFCRDPPWIWSCNSWVENWFFWQLSPPCPIHEVLSHPTHIWHAPLLHHPKLPEVRCWGGWLHATFSSWARFL